MEIINKTNHKVTILDASGNEVTTYIPKGKAARIVSDFAYVDMLQINGTMVPLSEPYSRKCTGLPPEKEGVIFIVSTVVREFHKNRKDLISPDPQKIVYNCNGYPKGCLGLVRNELTN